MMRLWHAPGNGDHIWRVSLEDPLTQEVHSVKDLESLFAFVNMQTGHEQSSINVIGDTK